MDDVLTLISQCRFSNCGHRSEPGCAILAGLNSGELSQQHWQSYNKFLREQDHFAEKFDVHARVEAKQKRKQFAKRIRKRPNKRDL